MLQEKSQKRTALVTGAGSGIGRAIAIEEARAGRRLLLNYSGNEAGARETERLIRETAPQTECLLFRADVSEEEEVIRMMAAAEERFGGVDILVNNAGLTRDGLTLRMSAESFDEVIRVNLRGAFLCCKHAGKQMLKRRFGRIVNISSISGLHGNIGQANYAASKAGLIGLSKTLAKEYASRGITVNVVAPGFIETRMTEALSEELKAQAKGRIPVGSFGKPEDIARAVGFFTAEEADYLTGQVLSVDGGLGM